MTEIKKVSFPDFHLKKASPVKDGHYYVADIEDIPDIDDFDGGGIGDILLSEDYDTMEIEEILDLAGFDEEEIIVL